MVGSIDRRDAMAAEKTNRTESLRSYPQTKTTMLVATNNRRWHLWCRGAFFSERSFGKELHCNIPNCSQAAKNLQRTMPSRSSTFAERMECVAPRRSRLGLLRWKGRKSKAPRGDALHTLRAVRLRLCRPVFIASRRFNPGLTDLFPLLVFSLPGRCVLHWALAFDGGGAKTHPGARGLTKLL